MNHHSSLSSFLRRTYDPENSKVLISFLLVLFSLKLDLWHEPAWMLAVDGFISAWIFKLAERFWQVSFLLFDFIELTCAWNLFLLSVLESWIGPHFRREQKSLLSLLFALYSSSSWSAKRFCMSIVYSDFQVRSNYSRRRTKWQRSPRNCSETSITLCLYSVLFDLGFRGISCS